MMHSTINTQWRAIAGLMAAAVLSACSESNSNGPNAGLSEVEAPR